MTLEWLHATLAHLPDPDAESQNAVRMRAENILRPSGALQQLDDVAVWMASWQATATPSVIKPVAIVFAADHGVARNDVSAYPTEVTAAMLKAYNSGSSTLSAFAKIAGAKVTAVDVGVGMPTKDMRIAPAMSPERFDAALSAGRDAVNKCDADLLVLGEMGIGNTTSAAAITAALLGGDTAQWVGRGTGVDDDGLQRKRDAVAKAVARCAKISDPIEILRQLGGCELAAISGAIVAARVRKIPIIIDGYVVTAAALPLFEVTKNALDHCWVGHCSAEPGHRKVLQHLGKPFLLDLDMRLGEGSGAMAAVPLVAMACAGITQVPTFQEWFGP
jgi:nicotinate-nucleotide--dimethylbenzimidazole phosphoribosyltransferase